MSNEDLGKLIETVISILDGDEYDCHCHDCNSKAAVVIVGELESKYHITPIGEEESK